MGVGWLHGQERWFSGAKEDWDEWEEDWMPHKMQHIKRTSLSFYTHFRYSYPKMTMLSVFTHPYENHTGLQWHEGE